MEILHDILHVLLHSLGELALMLPILFLTYLAMEALEHHAREKTLSRISGAKKVGPLLGGALGIIPQCGVAGGAANLYAGRVITAGTFLAVLLSTSDEMLPVLISLPHCEDSFPDPVKRLDNRYSTLALMTVGLIWLALVKKPIQFYSLLTVPLLLLYSGKRGKLKLKYFFYIF